MIIVIDGPAGSGKSSTAKAVAEKMNIKYLDSGALYRAATLIYLESDKDKDSFFTMLDRSSIRFDYFGNRFHVWIDGEEVTRKLRTPSVSEHVSKIASMPKVRTYINGLMKQAVENDIYIAEGRDLGTAVFPDADLKFYMSANVEERARRRYVENMARGIDTSFEDVKKNIESRDKIDSRRKHDPLKKADDAIEIDTTDVEFEQQVEQICSEIDKMIDHNEH